MDTPRDRNNINIRFKDWDCKLVVEKYSTGNPALMLIDKEDGELVLDITKNFPYFPFDDKYVAIKNYSENEGILDILIKEKIIEPLGPHAVIQSGYVTLPICRLLI